MSRSKSRPEIHVTTGDSDGVGLEVAAKALLNLKVPRGFSIYLYRGTKDSKICRHFLDLQKKNPKWLVDLPRTDQPPYWVREAARKCLEQPEHRALVTGPLSKTLILKSGINAIGHTQILAQESNTKDLFMTFLGARFSIALATGHCAISEISRELSASRIVALGKLIQANIKYRGSIGILGLNPHSGENGLFGTEETRIKNAIRQLRNLGVDCDGPLVPDAAFTPENIKKHRIFIGMYHDQSLIPFKAMHTWGDGVHVTLGLPFLRTSVDHGTAKDIAGRGIADPGSMRAALEYAIMKLEKKR